MRDIVGLYLDPPDRALVLCVDEKSHIQALERTAPLLPLLPMGPGQAERRAHDYLRHGTTRLIVSAASLSILDATSRSFDLWMLFTWPTPSGKPVTPAAPSPGTRRVR